MCSPVGCSRTPLRRRNLKHPSVAIVGYGAVGRGIHSLFPDAVIYDPILNIGTTAEVDDCQFAFVCVPTPRGVDGAADTSMVEKVVSWIGAEVILIRSTVPVGTTDRLRETSGERLVFQPEYGPAETPDRPFNDLRKIRWAILGGDRQDTERAAELYKSVFNADIVIQQTDARTAELTKYMENTFLALKVPFCNEFFDLAKAMDDPDVRGTLPFGVAAQARVLTGQGRDCERGQDGQRSGDQDRRQRVRPAEDASHPIPPRVARIPSWSR